MSRKEIDRYGIISRLLKKEINGTTASKLLSLSTRHVRRLKSAVRKEGVKGLIHGNRGKPSNNHVPEKEKKKIIALLHKKYPDFGPTFAGEKLSENHSITRDPKTIRDIQIAEGLWTPRKRKKRGEYREWRARKECFGEMLQFDGSYENWLEGRDGTTEQCLLATIDDATGTVVHALFSKHEGVLPVMGFWREYILAYGKPRSIYLDKFSTYKVNHKIASENPDVKTQFQRACNQVSIQPIFANSPQAKGRIERLFRTFQDRLIKELRLANIRTAHDANRFLRETFLPKFNAKFSVQPVSHANLHCMLTAEEKKNLASIFSRHTPRTVQNDFTLSFNNQWYQIVETRGVAVRKKDVVMVEEHTDNTIHICVRGKELNYTTLPARPKKTKNVQWVLAKDVVHTPHKPTGNHPWRLQIRANIERKNFNKIKQRILIHS
ncbi:ISNCY family transposase [Candidatus Uhrbacteria bacterium]|nr:ISNCY family transposase [Candidatus Uhrbacteria bacterium]